MTQDEIRDHLAERLARAGVEGIQAINPPDVRHHPTHWALVLDDGDDAPRAVRVLKHTPGVEDIRRARRTAPVVTFVVEWNAVRPT